MQLILNCLQKRYATHASPAPTNEKYKLVNPHRKLVNIIIHKLYSSVAAAISRQAQPLT